MVGADRKGFLSACDKKDVQMWRPILGYFKESSRQLKHFTWQPGGALGVAYACFGWAGLSQRTFSPIRLFEDWNCFLGRHVTSWVILTPHSSNA
jgi:hypothetical protein